VIAAFIHNTHTEIDLPRPDAVAAFALAIPARYIGAMRLLSAVGMLCAAGALAAGTRTPQTHRLEATPATVAYGYYWSEAPPVLRIASGDIIDVDTLLTNTPAGLEKAGVSEARIQGSLKAIVAEKHLTRQEAYQLVSIAGNVAVTQLVDKPNVGVHVRVPKSIFVAR
jgi:hypothetical protein